MAKATPPELQNRTFAELVAVERQKQVDYRALLAKYIKLVEREMNVGPLIYDPLRDPKYGEPTFTDEEWAELKRLAGLT